MKTSLDHLPDRKRRELAYVVDVIREGFAFAIARRTMPKLRGGRLLKIVLFGSYARGDWVADPISRYYSDYDLLVVVDREELTDVPEFWHKTEERLLADLVSGALLNTPPNPIYHTLDDVNEKLTVGRYFFTDIMREGVVLFEEPGSDFVEPQPLSAEVALDETRGYFELWFGTAAEFLAGANHAMHTDALKLAAFLFHQTTERLYHCFLLVHTLYSPPTHNLNRLRGFAEDIDPRLSAVWPRDRRFARRCYELLRRAYVEARYSPHYRITTEELEWLSQRVEVMQELVRELCEERIAALAETV